MECQWSFTCCQSPRRSARGSVALSVGKIEADLSSEVIPPAPVAAAEVGVRRVPVSGRSDRRRGALVPRYGLSFRDVEELLVERGVALLH
jgi:hypothetical protein